MGVNTPERFNPFTDRTARDIRNTLSEAYVGALSTMDPGPYASCARQWQEQNLARLYADYIDGRLLRYDRVLDEIRTGEIQDPMQQAVLIWNQGLFFEFHDHLETLWKAATGDMRQVLKGLIKAAGVYIHLEQGHQQAASSLAAKAYALLEQYRDCLTFIANSQTLLNKLETCNPAPPRLKFAALRD
jgi:hypothetical protein